MTTYCASIYVDLISVVHVDLLGIDKVVHVDLLGIDKVVHVDLLGIDKVTFTVY